MEIEKLKIKSNILHYGQSAAPEDEVEQKVTIRPDGRVKITHYVFGTGAPDYAETSEDKMNILVSDAADILSEAEKCLSNPDAGAAAANTGRWKMTLVYRDGSKIKIKGSLGSPESPKLDKLEKQIRKILSGTDDLYLFSGTGNVNSL